MPWLLFQTFVWMLGAGLIGAMLGCLAHSFFAGRSADADLAPAGAGAARAVARGPVVEASKAPAAITPVARANEPYSYPITTVGIPRGNPELIQPQIQKITLPGPPTTPRVQAATASAPAAAAAKPAEVTIRQAAAPAPAPATVATGYPVTTIGIPQGYVDQPSIPTAAALAAVAAPAARPASAKAAEPKIDDAQPRPEPLRPELARSPAPPAPPLVAANDSAPVAPVPPGAPAPAVTKPAASADQPYAPVAAGGAALAALAARAAAQPAAPTTLAPVAAPVGDDLMRIRSIDAAMQARLKAAGITRFSEIARWSQSDVARISQAMGLTGRIEQENWIEQSQILATGGETEYSRRRLRGEIPSASVASGASVAAAEPAAAAPVAPAAKAETSMAGAGAAATAAAAAMASAAIARATANVEPSMPAKLVDAIRENLVKPSAAPAADVQVNGDNVRVPRPDLAGLRSVRSEALRDVSVNDTQRGGGGRPGGVIEDLKRVRGIGVLIEKKLNSLGVMSYEQIANWTNADIDRVSQILDFKGRIERENWVEQARILASGGATEFSKRVDRGEA